MRWQTRPCRPWRFETLCVQRDIYQFGSGLFTSQGRLDSLMLDDNLRQDHTSRQRYLPRMCLQRAKSRFPVVKVAAFCKLLVKSHGPIDARTKSKAMHDQHQLY